MRAEYRHNDVIVDDALRRVDRPLTIAFAVAAAVVIAAIVAVALEPNDEQVAAISSTQHLADPCDNQTWPHFSAACIASKTVARPRR